MRVALLTNNIFPPREGIGWHILEIARRLERRGITPIVLAKGESWHRWDRCSHEGIEVRRYPFLPIRPFHQWAMRAQLQRWLAAGAEGADILHIHLPLLPPLPTDLPRIVTFHTPMLTDTRAIRETGLRPWLIKANARLFSQRAEHAHIRDAARLIVVSRGVARELDQHYDLAGQTPEVISNGVDSRWFAAASTETRASRRILYVGRLGYRKGLDRLIDALALLDDVALDLAGEGPLEPWLRRRIRRHGLEERVVFHGHLDRTRLRTLLGRTSCFVNPADYESGPLTLLEAMAAGAPVVTTATGLVEEMGPEPPLAIAEKTPAALAEAVERVLANPAEAAARAAEAQALVQRRFDWERICDRLVACYRALPRAAA